MVSNTRVRRKSALKSLPLKIAMLAQRCCLEAWHINMSYHAMNRDGRSYLPQEYLHLISTIKKHVNHIIEDSNKTDFKSKIPCSIILPPSTSSADTSIPRVLNHFSFYLFPVSKYKLFPVHEMPIVDCL